MKNNWFGFRDFDDGSLYNLPLEPLILHSCGGHLFSHVRSRALENAFNKISKFAGSFLVMFTSGTSANATREIAGIGCSEPGSSSSSSQVNHISSSKQNFEGFHFGFGPKGESANSMVFRKISASVTQFQHREAEWRKSYPLFSLATVLVPPFGNLSSNVLAVSSESTEVMDQRPCELDIEDVAVYLFLILTGEYMQWSLELALNFLWFWAIFEL